MAVTATRQERRLERVKAYQVEGATATFQVEAGPRAALAEVTLCRPGLVRYRIIPQGVTPDGFDLLSPNWSPSPASLQASQVGQALRLEAHHTAVEVQREPWRLLVRDASGRAVLQEMPQDLNARGLPQSQPTGFTENAQGPAACRVTLRLEPDERFLGLGEKGTALDKRGQRLVCWNRNPYGPGTELAYKNIPFLVSSRGYGLFLNDTRRSTWDLGRTSNFACTIEVDGPYLDLFIILGDSLRDVLGKYADLTGHAPLPPRWSFGVWVSPFGEHLTQREMDQQAVLELAQEIRRRQLPCDVLHLDPYWMGDQGYCSFQWGRERYPDPASMVSQLREKGFRLCLWEHPYIDVETEMYREGAEKGFLVKRADGSVYDVNLVIKSSRRRQYVESFYDPGGIVDFSNPEAAQWYKEKHRPLLEMGVAVFKTDFGEEIPEDAHFANGKTGKEMHNAYPLLYNRAVFEVTGEYTDRPMVWGRSGFAGIQRTPVQWSGDPLPDLLSLAATIRAGLSFGMSGVPFWTFDLGGFKGEPTPHDYVRWVQVGLLLSHSRFHGTTPRLPWNLGEEVFAIVQRWVQTRYRLLPYIYSAALEATHTGLPVMRPLALEFQDDPGSWAVQHQYLLGPSLLVAPVLSEDDRVDIYLPPGTWYDFWTGDRVAGPAVLARTVGLDTLPVYVRGSAILPTGPVSDTVPDLWDPLTIQIYPQAQGRLEIPEEGGRPSTVVQVSRSRATTIQARGPQRGWQLRLRDTQRPEQVAVSATGRSTWRYHEASRTLEVDVEPCEGLELTLPLSRGGGP